MNTRLRWSTRDGAGDRDRSGQWQLRIAAGERLTIAQEDVGWSGCALECRLYAEDPENQFLPSPGRITRLQEPSGPGIRLDSGVYEGCSAPMEYDPLLAKLAVWASSREATIARMRRALDEYKIGGIRTNRAFFSEIMDDECFRAGLLSTAFLEQFFERRKARTADPEAEAVAALVAALTLPKPAHVSQARGSSEWLRSGREAELR